MNIGTPRQTAVAMVVAMLAGAIAFAILCYTHKPAPEVKTEKTP